MPPKKKSNPAKTKSKQVVVRTVPKQVVGAALDQKAREYARLLADPCHAPLVHPVMLGLTVAMSFGQVS